MNVNVAEKRGMTMSKNIEKDLAVSPLAEFLGATRTEKLKDKVAEMILEKIDDDLQETISRDYLIEFDDIREIVGSAVAEVKEEIKQKLKAKYMALAEEAISKVRVED